MTKSQTTRYNMISFIKVKNLKYNRNKKTRGTCKCNKTILKGKQGNDKHMILCYRVCSQLCSTLLKVAN